MGHPALNMQNIKRNTKNLLKTSYQFSEVEEVYSECFVLLFSSIPNSNGIFKALVVEAEKFIGGCTEL